MNSLPKCNPDRLARFLRGQLNPSERDDLEDHLEHCRTCQSRLDSSVADQDWLHDCRSFLVDDEFDQLSSAAPVTQATIVPQRQHLQPSTGELLGLLRPTDDPHMLGRIGSYEVIGVIGQGGMGVVLKCLDRSLNRYVAIKVLAPHLGNSGAARQRFAREAQAAAAVIHENVIAIYGVSQTDALPYLVMPYERGISLQKRIENEGALSLVEILRIALQIASGLAAAHDQGLVHRDVKPANILLADGVERVKITDFGLARAVDDASLTRSGVIAGTPQYMSPEQARGESLDARSDLFSLGSVIYATSVGHPPFRAETSYGVLRRITDSDPTPITDLNPDLPAWLRTLIEKLHAKSPSDRYQSAQEVASDLASCLAHVQQPQLKQIPRHLFCVAAKHGSRRAAANRRRFAKARRIALGCAAAAACISLLWGLPQWHRGLTQLFVSPLLSTHANSHVGIDQNAHGDLSASKRIDSDLTVETDHAAQEIADTRWFDEVAGQIQATHHDIRMLEDDIQWTLESHSSR